MSSIQLSGKPLAEAVTAPSASMTKNAQPFLARMSVGPSSLDPSAHMMPRSMPSGGRTTQWKVAWAFGGGTL